ncbi:MAG TPA: DUF2203 family protein [Planctomycetes bacterium]|nr:DUF2203 family protein [Planctomycetota bacterium]
MKGKIFTQAEASRAIPYLKRIATDAIASMKLIQRHGRAIANLRADDVLSQEEREEAIRQHEAKIEILEARIEDCRKELEPLGCFLDDPERGIIKFYGEMDSRIVYFTWKPGEPRVAFWHPMEKTYSDRQPIDGDEMLAGNTP